MSMDTHFLLDGWIPQFSFCNEQILPHRSGQLPDILVFHLVWNTLLGRLCVSIKLSVLAASLQMGMTDCFLSL